MFDYYSRHEREVRKALKIIAGQRVAMILQPGNVLVIERSPTSTEWFEEAVQTCRIRGWVEVLHEGLPSADLDFHDQTPILGSARPKTHYKLTEGGWNAIRGTHALVIVAIILSALSLAAGVASVALTWEQMKGPASTKAP
ncbi:hypothetical protein [Variovorax sp. PBL-E5]|uniref:hypothetical protein n=1 Tax=Variovorax sp. PBL-E5 TaxID=434014 RepID=UPI0013A598B8|nr:hypothetical protein [Variovorax sp. PBL-E5]